MHTNVQKNLNLMKTLDDSWNTQDWDTFKKRHAEQVTITWPAKPAATHGIDAHVKESQDFFKIFPDNHLDNNPYRVAFGQDDWTCTIARFTGTMQGEMQGFDGKVIAPTHKRFEIEFCTVAHWKDDQIIEENLFYDAVGLMKQIGVI